MKFTFFAALFLSFSVSIFAQDFDYLKIKRNTVKTMHQAKYEIKIDKSFKLLGEFHHQPTYGEKQFNVSFTAFSDGKNLVMIHAENHTDGSGGLDYSELAPAYLNGLKFTAREQCATEEDEAELNENPQIKFIRSKGFDLSVPFYLKQFFTTSEDGKAEIVISYGRKIASCKDIPEDFKSRIEQQVKDKITVKKFGK